VSNEADLHPFRDLFDAAIRHSGAKATCPKCRRTVIFKTAALWRLFNRNGWDDRFEQVRRRLCCLLCWHSKGIKVRPTLEFCDEPATDLRLPMPENWEWKQEQRRRR